MKTQTFYSNGKLLLTGEYAILDGAIGLAVPTKLGQSLKVSSSDSGIITWTSINEKEETWFDASYQLPDLKLITTSDKGIAKKLCQILKVSKTLNSGFLNDAKGYHIETVLRFPRNWGLGSSSTLINNIAQWAAIDAHELLRNTFGGSGYDISSAQHNTPIFYNLNSGRPIVKSVSFNPVFKDQLFFVHLNKKQNSREAIANYRKQEFDSVQLIASITNLTEQLVAAASVSDVEALLIAHESILSKVLKMPPVKQKFPDYFGEMKSLGGWGGDFVLATGNQKTPDYFKVKGFNTVIPYSEMVL